MARFFTGPQPIPRYAQELDAALIEWRGFVGRLLDDRSSNPRDDFLTTVSAAVDGGQISREEAIAICVHMLQAGHETTTNLIGNMVYCLLRNPEQLAKLREAPEKIAAAMEETLRLEPSALNARRTCTVDLELGGQLIRKGQTVVAAVPAANRDPERYDHPGDFDIDRDLSSTGHLSFGRGIHACLGAALARLEAPIAVGTFLERYPNTRLRSTTPAWKKVRDMHGLKELWVET